MKIEINNFRSFQNQIFDFKKTNILIGENSAGKSSLLKFLLVLKQSISDKNSNLKLYGDFVDLGNYNEIIYNHENNRLFSFSFTFLDRYPDFFLDFISNVFDEEDDDRKSILKDHVRNQIGDAFQFPTLVKFTLDENLDSHNSVSIEFYNEKIGKLYVSHNSEDDNEEIDDLIGKIPKCTLEFLNDKMHETFTNIEYFSDAFMSRIDATSLRKSCQDKDLDNSIFYKIAYLLVTQNFVHNFLKKIRFVNPLHAEPARFYSKRDKSDFSKVNLEKFINFIGNKKLDEETKKYILHSINETLNSFGLASQIELINDESISVFELRTKIKNLWSNITDVGYGVSLQIPILFQALISDLIGGEVLLIEQPEVHLHPKLQANFIDTLLKIGPRNTYFIETHSEHIVRKLQSIAKNNSEVNRNDISIYYFTRDEFQFSISSHEIDMNYRLVPNIPSGFFDSSYLLAKELL